VQPDAGRSAWAGDGRHPAAVCHFGAVDLDCLACSSLSRQPVACFRCRWAAPAPREAVEPPAGTQAQTDHARHRLASRRHLTTARTACCVSRMPQMGGRLRRGEAQLWV